MIRAKSCPPLSVVFVPEQILDVPEIVGEGLLLTVSVFVAVPEHPLELVTVTLYVPAVETEIDCVVDPVDQLYELKPLPELKLEFEPVQIAETPVIVGVGEVAVVTAIEALPEHPFEFVTVTE